jgi:hypothetical protein
MARVLQLARMHRHWVRGVPVMFVRAVPLVLLLIAPAAASYLIGHAGLARDLALGAVLAFYLGILAWHRSVGCWRSSTWRPP